MEIKIKNYSIEKMVEMDFWLRKKLDPDLKDYEITKIENKDKEVTSWEKIAS